MKGETIDTWFSRYLAYKHGLGQQTTDSTYRTWIAPRIGGRTWETFKPRHAEKIRDDLDHAIAERRAHGHGRGRLLPRSASDVWQFLNALCKFAQRTKQRDLRALIGRANPCTDVEPPGEPRARGVRRKPFIYPVEFAKVVACRGIPREWRELYAIAAMLYLRPGELAVLLIEDLDVEHRVAHVTKAWNYTTQEVKEPKTREGIRDVPIPPSLIPLLRRLKRTRKPTDLVAPQLTTVYRDNLSAKVRSHLRLAGVTRKALHESDFHVNQAVFRTWRDTGLTWLAMSGLPLLQIMHRAGHTTPRTTAHYVKQAEDLTGEMGKPFAALPAELVNAKSRT